MPRGQIPPRNSPSCTSRASCRRLTIHFDQQLRIVLETIAKIRRRHGSTQHAADTATRGARAPRTPRRNAPRPDRYTTEPPDSPRHDSPAPSANASSGAPLPSTRRVTVPTEPQGPAPSLWLPKLWGECATVRLDPARICDAGDFDSYGWLESFIVDAVISVSDDGSVDVVGYDERRGCRSVDERAL
jgi:hypothetical protein